MIRWLERFPHRYSGLLGLVNITIDYWMLVNFWSFYSFNFWVCAFFPSELLLGFEISLWDYSLASIWVSRFARLGMSSFWLIAPWGIWKVWCCIDDYYWWMEYFSSLLWLPTSLTVTLTAATLSAAALTAAAQTAATLTSATLTAATLAIASLTEALCQQLWQQSDNCSDNDYPKSLPWLCFVNKKSLSLNNVKSLSLNAN